MRISMSLPENLLEEFDKVLSDRGYTARSKGIRAALNDYILRNKGLNKTEGEKIGIISVVYDYDYKGVIEKVANIQHEFMNYINVSMHVYLKDNYCLDVIIVDGDASNLEKLIEKMKKVKGVENVKLVNTPPTNSLTQYNG